MKMFVCSGIYTCTPVENIFYLKTTIYSEPRHFWRERMWWLLKFSDGYYFHLRSNKEKAFSFAFLYFCCLSAYKILFLSSKINNIYVVWRFNLTVGLLLLLSFFPLRFFHSAISSRCLCGYLFSPIFFWFFSFLHCLFFSWFLFKLWFIKEFSITYFIRS